MAVESRSKLSGAAAERPSQPPFGTAGEAAVRELLTLLGEDPEREGLRSTPRRVVESLSHLTSGYAADLEDIVAGAVFAESYDEMVLVRDIAFYSLCEHHLLPFYGRAHVAYIPDGRVLGLSKLPRIVDAFARRLQVQERLTTEIANAIDTHLHPKGVAVVLEADHLCMMMRGVEKAGNRTITSSMTGVFRRDPRTRGEFLGLIRDAR
ncbi:MAG: GTP cyclohydrolase I FolE [Candidatus Dormibacteria bacterium]